MRLDGVLQGRLSSLQIEVKDEVAPTRELSSLAGARAVSLLTPESATVSSRGLRSIFW
jgi:hypothetical protein